MILLYKIKIYSFYKIYLLRFINKFEMYIKSLNVKNINFLIFTLPVQSKLFTVLKSPHVNKKSREQFQLSSYKRLLDIYSSSSKTIDALMKLELPSGVEVEIKV